MSRYFVERGLNVDPRTEAPAPPRLVLDEAEQRRLHDSLVRIAERAASSVERLTARMDTEDLDAPRLTATARAGSHRETAAIARLRLPAIPLLLLLLLPPQLPLVLLWLVAVDFCAVCPEVALDLR